VCTDGLYVNTHTIQRVAEDLTPVTQRWRRDAEHSLFGSHLSTSCRKLELATMVILIVEDQALLGMSLAWELEDAGHKVLGPVSSTTLAQHLAAQEHPDLALIDMELQRQNQGIELARALHRQFSIPSLMLSSEPSPIREHHDAVLGVIAKPFNPADIHRSVTAAQAILKGDSPPLRSIPHVLEILERTPNVSSVR
jgi:two-component system, response regulator PdtaR